MTLFEAGRWDDHHLMGQSAILTFSKYWASCDCEDGKLLSAHWCYFETSWFKTTGVSSKIEVRPLVIHSHDDGSFSGHIVPWDQRLPGLCQQSSILFWCPQSNQSCNFILFSLLINLLILFSHNRSVVSSKKVSENVDQCFSKPSGRLHRSCFVHKQEVFSLLSWKTKETRKCLYLKETWSFLGSYIYFGLLLE